MLDNAAYVNLNVYLAGEDRLSLGARSRETGGVRGSSIQAVFLGGLQMRLQLLPSTTLYGTQRSVGSVNLSAISSSLPGRAA
jgi:hypothetical protein